MKTLKHALILPLLWILRLFLKFKKTVHFFNFFYENLPFKATRYIVDKIEQPKYSFVWKIILVNGKKVKTRVEKNDVKTWQFALSYKWHDPLLNNIENKIEHFYGKKKLLWIDVGSNLGLRSLIPLSKGRDVVFIEPNVELNNINEERCKLNKFNNYKILNCGIGEKNEELEIYIDKSSYLSSFEKNVSHSFDIQRIERVEVKTLDSIVYSLSNKYDYFYIKIDTEGFEGKVLHGSKRLIEDYKPDFIIEINEKGEHFTEIINEMKMFGYRIFEIPESILKINRIFEITHIQSFENYCFKGHNFFFSTNDELIGNLNLI